MLKEVPGFMGCMFSREFQGLHPGNSAILNIGEVSGPGTHWVAIYRKPNGEYLYFDSFGQQPDKTVTKAIGSNRLLFNMIDFQKETSYSCGYFASYFVKSIQTHTFGEVLADLDATNQDETVLFKLKR